MVKGEDPLVQSFLSLSLAKSRVPVLKPAQVLELES